MTPFEKCPMCGGKAARQRTGKLPRGGVNLAVVTVDAIVCLHGGDRLSCADAIRSFEKIPSKLDRQQVDEFEPLGISLRVPI